MKRIGINTPESTLPEAGATVLYALAKRVIESSKITTS